MKITVYTTYDTVYPETLDGYSNGSPPPLLGLMSHLWRTCLGFAHPIIYSRTTKEHLSHGAFWQVVKAITITLPHLSNPVAYSNAAEGMALHWCYQKVLNDPTLDCYFHPPAPLSVSVARWELAVWPCGEFFCKSCLGWIVQTLLSSRASLT